MAKLIPDVPDCPGRTADQELKLAQFLQPLEQEFMLARSLIAQDMSTPMWVLELLAEDHKQIVRHSVAHNPMATEDVASTALSRVTGEVLGQEWQAWQQIRTQFKQMELENLISFFSYKSLTGFYPARYRPAMIAALPFGYRLDPDIFNELVVSGPARVQIALLKRPDLIWTEQQWWTLCQSAEEQVQSAIQSYPNIPTKVRIFARETSARF